MNKLFKLIFLIYCFALNMQAMQKPFAHISRAELKKLILKSIPYSYAINVDETKTSKTYSTRLLFLDAHLQCKYNDREDYYCLVIDKDSGEVVGMLDEEAEKVMSALYDQKLKLAGKSAFEIDRKKRGFEEAKKLLSEILKITDIGTTYVNTDLLEAVNPNYKLIWIELPKKLTCRRILNNEESTCYLEDDRHGFDGKACLKILEERQAELKKEKAEIK